MCWAPCWDTAVNKTCKGPSPMELPALWKTDKKQETNPGVIPGSTTQ